MSTEALARVLMDLDTAREGLSVDVPYEEQAERILADPAPLLAALAEAGVLTEKWALQMILTDGTGGTVIPGWDGKDYASEADVRADVLYPLNWPVRCYVTEWAKP